VLEPLRVRSDREPPRSRQGGRRDADPGVERDDAALVRDQRIDVELGDLRNVDRDLRHFHERRGDALDVRGRARAKTFE
jgi:hypothetical protein